MQQPQSSAEFNLTHGDEVLFRGRVARSRSELGGREGELIVTSQNLIFMERRSRLPWLFSKRPIVVPLAIIKAVDEGPMLEWIVDRPRLRIWLDKDLAFELFGEASVLRALTDVLRSHTEPASASDQSAAA